MTAPLVLGREYYNVAPGYQYGAKFWFEGPRDARYLFPGESYTQHRTDQVQFRSGVQMPWESPLVEDTSPMVEDKVYYAENPYGGIDQFIFTSRV